MRHFTLDGKDLMLNDREVQYWCETGNFVRIREGDDEDVEYRELKHRMIVNGDKKFYEQCCP